MTLNHYNNIRDKYNKIHNLTSTFGKSFKGEYYLKTNIITISIKTFIYSSMEK